MPQKTPTCVASYISQLAKEHNVAAARDTLSHVATAITALSGDDIRLDEIEQMLVKLKRKGVLSKAEILQLHERYLCEKKLFHEE